MEGWGYTPVKLDIVNLDQDGNEHGSFDNDDFIPGIPGYYGSQDGIVSEFVTLLELDKGFHILGVNSDDGFKASIGPFDQVIGEYNGGRGSEDSIFYIYVEHTGLYPYRVLWYEGEGGANIEIFSIVNGEKILINDLKNENSIKAYTVKGVKFKEVASERDYINILSKEEKQRLADEERTVEFNKIQKVVDERLKQSLQLDFKDGKLPDNVELFGNASISYENDEPLGYLNLTEDQRSNEGTLIIKDMQQQFSN